MRKTEDKVRCYSKNNTSVSEHRYRIKSQSQAYLNNRSQIRKKIKYTQTPTLLKVHHDLLIPKHKLKIGEELDEEKKENCNEMFDHY